MRILKRKRLWLVLGLLGGGWLQNYYTFGSWSVCKKCGERCSQTDFYVPFTNHIWWTLTSERETRLSKTVHRLGFVQPHAHDWEFVHGSGAGVYCAIGHGDRIVPFLESDEASEFLTIACDCGQRRFASEMFRDMLDPDTAIDLRFVILAVDYSAPPNTPAQFERWWAASTETMCALVKFPLPALDVATTKPAK